MEYREISVQESHGDRGSFGLKILATVDRELSREERLAVIKATKLIEMAIRTEDLRLDPEEQATRAEERAKILELFPVVFSVEEVPNGYCGDWCCTQKPWYRVLTPRAWIQIGWRKRVINVDWSGSTVRSQAAEIFPTGDFTKNGKSCHAWGYEAAKSQLARILEAI